MLLMALSAPPVVIASVVGVVINPLEALTQILEQTLAFSIKLVAIAAATAGCDPAR